MFVLGMQPLPVAVELDVFEHLLPRLVLGSASSVVYQLSLERLEERLHRLFEYQDVRSPEDGVEALNRFTLPGDTTSKVAGSALLGGRLVF